ncbi:MAG: rhomboid family intramembrane serine protease [Candidatus Krumholzibacteriota bacterium]|nr:rhomboid family intramembrane serine protease [Candidatus Krumholzibacteriota bacterium]
MEQANEAFTVMLIIANCIFSYRGFRSRLFFDKHIFWVRKVLRDRQIFRILTSGFLHAGWGHLLFNMFALYSFSIGVGTVFGFGKYIIIYFVSLTAGNLLALFIHRRDPEYRALGASGAVCGVIFSSILLFPDSSIYLLFLPIGIPSWLFGIGFVLISIYGIKSRFGNIGHEAHLGGAIAGVVVSILIDPRLASNNPALVVLLLLPILLFLIFVVKFPGLIGLDDRRKIE